MMNVWIFIFRYIIEFMYDVVTIIWKIWDVRFDRGYRP